MMRNWKMLMFFNRLRGRGIKYVFEVMRLIINCRVFYILKMVRRIIYGMFVNLKGGEGNNCLNDLKQEYIVKDYKVIFYDLRGNKILNVVIRFIVVLYSQYIIGDRIDEQSSIFKNFIVYIYGDCKEDVKEIVNCLQKLKLFKFKVDRFYSVFFKISKSFLD